MEANNIRSASLLDIVFDGRNKTYGAYELRKGYNKRLMMAMVAVAGLTGGLFGADYLVGHGNGGGARPVVTVMDVQLEEVREEKKPDLPPPPPPPPAPAQKVQMTKFTPPLIVKDNEVKEDEKPPEQEKLEDTRIGAITQEGVKDEGIVTGPASDGGGKGVVESPRVMVSEDYDRTFVKVEIESEYPGGAPAWLRYLNKNFRYPDEAINNEIEGVVVVQFIVDKEGKVSETEAISGPTEGGLRAEAVRVIRQSGTWIPAVQNGRKVKSYKRQPVVFRMARQ